MQSREIGISIIVCSYNGESKISKTLQHILEQKITQPIKWELVFVDNNSTDNTNAIVLAYSKQFRQRGVNVKILAENKKGKYYALNLAIAHAQYAYFIIVDDDNWLDSKYVQTAFQLIHNNPNIGAIGCKSEAVFGDDVTLIPNWFYDNPERLAIGTQGVDGNVTSRRHLWGAGMVSQTDLYAKLFANHPSLLFDNDIEDIYVAEDTEYCLRLVLKGYELHYNSSLKIQHFIPKERLTLQYWQNLNSKIDNSFKIIDLYHAVNKLINKKYQTKVQKARLKLITPLRYKFSINKLKKQKNKILLGFLYPNSNFNSKPISILQAFLKDDSLQNPNALLKSQGYENS